ncbi:tetratricopeptide repeat protein [Flavobacterium sp. MC2016-06]|uniref:tetratricopeptide repeat protein n=1 Tax=Flavobacterium sp. MC2016-06 TaxID=2676308 RepID=UPI0012BA7043|nr:tetratricopeptide repeat protein [Flavobacterium sp. MC2016-06]MBU3860793.1 tetratricopeptide repeat protein [Flavobacterium sp. MC2016-06]
MKYPFIFSSIIFIFIARTLIIVLHELGHAIPAMLLTKEKVSVYIGSYGNPEKSFNFKIGNLDIWLSYEKLSWDNGLCIPSAKNISRNKQLVYVLCGPLCPFIFSFLLFYSTLEFELEDTYLHFSVIFLGISTIDLFRNLVPNSTPIELFSGKKTYNDGYNIKRLIGYRNLYPKYVNAINLYNHKDYHSAIIILDTLMNKTIEREEVYRLNISSNIQVKNYEKAKILNDDFITKFSLNSNDYSSAGLIYSNLGFNQESLEFYDKSLEQNSNDVYALNNKAYTLNLLGRYDEAIPLFDKTIEIDKSHAYSYNNRGLSKIKIGQIDEGLKDIQDSMKLDANNSYAYRNLGIYHFELNQYDKALELFLKAKELDPYTHMIEELISRAENINKNDYKLE